MEQRVRAQMRNRLPSEDPQNHLDRFSKFADDQLSSIDEGFREHHHAGAIGSVDSDCNSSARRRFDGVGLQFQLQHRGATAERYPLSIGIARLLSLENDQHGLCRCKW